MNNVVRVRPLAGLATGRRASLRSSRLAIGLFRGSFTKTVPVTVISDRAGLVMNPDAKVKMRGVAGRQGRLDRDAARRHGRPAPGDGSVAAATHPVQRRTSTSRRRRCSAPSSSSWSRPTNPSPQPLRAGSGDSGPARHRRDQHRLPAAGLGAGQDRPGQAQRDTRRDRDRRSTAAARSSARR